MSQSLIIKKSSSNVTLVRSGASAASGSYTLPPATNATLGGIIVGDNLTVTANGVLSGVNSYTLPAATNSTLGGVIVGSGVSVDNGTISVNQNYLNNSTTNSTLTYSEGVISGFHYSSIVRKATGANSTNSERVEWLSNTGKFGNIQWTLKPNTGINNWTWGGLSLDANTTDATRPEMSLSTNYSLDFSAGNAYGRGIGISTRDIYMKETYFSGPSLPAKEWTDNSFLIQSYADSRYLLTTNFTYANLTGTPVLATVATSGSYTDLSNLPTLFDGSYTSLTNVPATFAPSAHTHTVSQITDFPTLATVATSGLYSDLTGTPDLTGYLTTATAASTYATISSLSSYLTTASASSTYLTISTAASTYQTVSGMSSYLTTASAASTYQPIGSYATTGANTFSGTQSLAGNIVDKPRLQAARDTKTAPAISAGTLTLDLNTSNFFAVSLNAAITTLSVTNVPTGVVASFVLEFTADGTARAVSWPASFKFPSGTAPTLTTTSGKKDVFVVYTSDDGTTFDIVIAGQNL